MPRLRVVRATGSSPTALKLRVTRVTGSGPVPVAQQLRVTRVTGSGALAIVVNPLPNWTGVEPESDLTITASLLGGLVADSWTWRIVTGTAAINGTGDTVIITAPSHINGTTITVGVTGTKDAVTSAEVTFTVAVLPQTEWWWTGTAWIPHIEAWS